VAVDESITLGLTEGGVATSGRDRRRWRRGGKELHHLIDPRTGAPAETDLLRVTAVGDDAVAAEVLAKSLFLAGEREAAESTVPAVLVTADGRTRFSRGLQQ
jgi:thiamine biosynthesis lipoprotein ApbE